ncbi:C3a anaphylatoxin chemotactic receptor-like [Strongylocentrotus purpuratus]|uniref:G-protein coupled receptors family 1 profile domain-containing protein n=1 Tax=Strongylocentrotus purpuratus TaxID=7668 RepID=A0A7M7P3S8_STRPU|nr:C3a anaphylatoxin chemotactic receptor-like [Strongylocentrotus purpuratus]
MTEPLRTYLYHTAMLVFSSTGALINFATVCAILLSKALRKEQNIFTFNLALADCISAIALFINNFYGFPEIPFQLENGSWIQPLFTAGLFLSILSTLAIAFERFIILRYDALGHRHIVTAKRSIAICVIGWIVVPSTYFIIHGFNRHASNILVNVVSPCAILACLTITALCYILIYKKIASISDIVLNDAALQRRAKNSKKILVTFALVVASTTACWVIMCCVLLVEIYGALEETLWFIVLADVGNVLVSINGILNPVIIWLRLTVFRNKLDACFGSRICRRAFESQNPSLAQSHSTTTTIKQSVSTINIDLKDITEN